MLYCKCLKTKVTEEMHDDKHNKTFTVFEIACHIFI